MYKPAIRCSTMPMFHIWMNFYYVSFLNHLYRPAFFLKISSAASNKQNLPTRMFMPIIPCAWFKSYITYRAIKYTVIRNQHFKPCCPYEIVIRNFLSPFGKITLSLKLFDLFILYSPLNFFVILLNSFCQGF